MTTGLSSTIKNGQNLQLKAGVVAISQLDLLQIGGPANEAYPVTTSDYAKQGTIGSILTQTSVVAGAVAGYKRQASTLDALGNIYIVSPNSSSQGITISKYSPTGAPLIIGVVVDATAAAMQSAKIMLLSNGNLVVVYGNSSTGGLLFAIVDAALNIVVAATAIATGFVTATTIYYETIVLSNGNFAVVYQNSTHTQMVLQTYTVAGVAVLGATNIQAITGNALVHVRIEQLSSGNIVAAFRTTATPVGTSFTIFTTAGVNVVANTIVDSTATAGFLELAVMTGFFAIADANGTALKAGVYSDAGVLQGGLYTGATTQNVTTYPQVKLLSDGVQFWLAFIKNTGGLVVVQIPTSGANFVTSAALATATATSTCSLDVAFICGQLVAFVPSTSTAGGNYLIVGLPNSALGVVTPYLIGSAVAVGVVAGTTGTQWPRIISGGDFTAIFVYDQQNTAGIFLAISKVSASAIIGISQTAVAANNPGTAVSVNSGPGSYPCNAMAGTMGVAFDHSTNILVGNIGTLFGNSIAFGAAISSGGVSSSTTKVGTINNPPPGFLGIFGAGLYKTLYNTGNFTVPDNVTRIRVRLCGGGGGGFSVGSGGAGGGFAYGTFTVVPGTVYTVTIGAGGTGGGSPSAGGTTSFGTLISATGGNPGVSGAVVSGAGGVGIGGDFRASGGTGGAGIGSGGGGCGSQLGDGGNSGSATNTGGAGVAGGNSSSTTNSGGGSAFGSSSGTSGAPDCIGGVALTTTNGAANPISAPLRFPFDGFTGGGGGSGAAGTSGAGGPGAGGGASSGANSTGNGGVGGGSGGSGGVNTAVAGLGGGGGGGVTTGVAGSKGVCVVEW